MPNSIAIMLLNALELFKWIVIARILLTWLPNLNWHSPPFSWLSAIVDPVLIPFRNIIPAIGGFDLSPILLIIVLDVLGMVIRMVAG